MIIYIMLMVNPSMPKASLSIVIALIGVPSFVFRSNHLLPIGLRTMIIVSEIGSITWDRTILYHHYSVTINVSTCVQVGNPPTSLPLHHFLQLSQKWNALHTQFLLNISWLSNLSGWTEVNPDSRYVINPIDRPFSNYTDFSADIPMTSTTLC